MAAIAPIVGCSHLAPIQQGQPFGQPSSDSANTSLLFALYSVAVGAFCSFFILTFPSGCVVCGDVGLSPKWACAKPAWQNMYIAIASYSRQSKDCRLELDNNKDAHFITFLTMCSGAIGALGSVPGTVCAHPLDVVKIRIWPAVHAHFQSLLFDICLSDLDSFFAFQQPPRFANHNRWKLNCHGKGSPPES